MSKHKDIFSAHIEKIQRQRDIEDAERKREQFRNRLQIARDGVKAFNEKRIPDALRAFYTYLRLLEDNKGVGDNGLTPALFDLQKDLPELLLISGVYWNLALIFHGSESEKSRNEFRQYLQKYILFSKGMPYEKLSADTIKKFLRKARPKYREDFVQAYRSLGGKRNCFVVTSLLDVIRPETIDILYVFRDQVLAQHRLGRLALKLYYGGVGRAVAWGLDRSPDFLRKQVACGLDWFAKQLQARFYW